MSNYLFPSNDPTTSRRKLVWFVYALLALLSLKIDNLTLWAGLVVGAALVLALIPQLRPSESPSIDSRDLIVVAALYIGVVAAFRVAFTVFTTENVLGLFLSFAAGLLLGVVGPIVYQVWLRNRDLTSLGLGTHQLPATLVVAAILAAIQFFTTLWGYDLPAPVDWVPLLVMSLVVGLFEAVFFRGFIQLRFEASLGPIPAVVGAALLYSLYHIGYGMGMNEMWFLFGLGIVYAASFRLTSNILVLWPLLTPLGAFFNNLQAGDIQLPWEAILGFADVAVVMGVVIWLARRRIQKRRNTETEPASPEISV
jgi:membrane protease YdiL (CAAX protease family)